MQWEPTRNARFSSSNFFLSYSSNPKVFLLLLTITSSTAKQTWSQPALKGFPPNPRDGHSCTTVRDNLFVFGGTDGKNLLNDLHVLDTSEPSSLSSWLFQHYWKEGYLTCLYSINKSIAYHTWILPTIRGRGPEAREGHGAALVGSRLFIFGGCGRYPYGTELFYNDLSILDTGALLQQARTMSVNSLLSSHLSKDSTLSLYLWLLSVWEP